MKLQPRFERTHVLGTWLLGLELEKSCSLWRKGQPFFTLAYFKRDWSSINPSGPTELVKKLWKQLVVICTAFGVRNIENRRFERSLELLKRAEVLLSRWEFQRPHAACFGSEGRGFMGCTHVMHGRSRMTIDPRIATMPARSTSGFHPPGRGLSGGIN